jgi:hypothetical protein
VEPRVLEELEHDASEGLVHLDHRDVVPPEPGLRERTLAGERVAVEHPVRVDAGEAERDEPRARLEPEARRGILARDEHRGRAVDDRARVPRGDPPALLEGGGQSGELLERRVAARVLVDAHEDRGPRRADPDRNDLPLEAALVDRRHGAAMRFERIFVERLAREAPLLGDHLRRDPLRHHLPALVQLRREALEAAGGQIRPHRHTGHRLETGRDHDVEMTRLHRRRGVERGLHRRPALPVDRRAADGLGPPRHERGHPGDVQGLLADLADTAHLDVLDLRRVEIEPPGEPVQRLCRELLRADARKRPVPPADRRPDRLDDERIAHGVTVPPPP